MQINDLEAKRNNERKKLGKVPRMKKKKILLFKNAQKELLMTKSGFFFEISKRTK